MGRIVIACYRPKAGQAVALRELVRTHVERLRGWGLVTDRTPILMEAADGTMIEVFEWRSPEAIETAHGHAGVLAMWEEFGQVCDYVPIAQVPEAATLFSEFAPG